MNIVDGEGLQSCTMNAHKEFSHSPESNISGGAVGGHLLGNKMQQEGTQTPSTGQEIEYRKCVKCDQVWPLKTGYWKHKYSRGGYDTRCIECMKATNDRIIKEVNGKIIYDHTPVKKRRGPNRKIEKDPIKRAENTYKRKKAYRERKYSAIRKKRNEARWVLIKKARYEVEWLRRQVNRETCKDWKLYFVRCDQEIYMGVAKNTRRLVAILASHPHFKTKKDEEIEELGLLRFSTRKVAHQYREELKEYLKKQHSREGKSFWFNANSWKLKDLISHFQKFHVWYDVDEIKQYRL